MPSNRPLISVRPTIDEKKRIERIAASYGMSISQYMIMAALEHPKLKEKD